MCSPSPHSCEHAMSTHSHKAHEQARIDGQHVTTCTTHGHSCECVCEPHEHTREHTGHSNSIVGTRSTSHTHTHTHTRGQPHLRSRGSCMHQAHTCHTAVPSLAVGSCTARCGDHRLRAGNLRGSSGRLQEGEEGESAHGEHAPSLPCPPPPPRALTGTVGEAVEAGAALLARGSRVAQVAAAQPAHPTQLVHGAPGVTGAGCRGLGVMPWAPEVALPPARSPSKATRSPWHSG